MKTRRERRLQKRIIPMQFPLFFTCTDVMSSQFPPCSRGLGASPNWNARLIKEEVEDGDWPGKKSNCSVDKTLKLLYRTL